MWYDNQQLSATLGIDVVHACVWVHKTMPQDDFHGMVAFPPAAINISTSRAVAVPLIFKGIVLEHARRLVCGVRLDVCCQYRECRVVKCVATACV